MEQLFNSVPFSANLAVYIAIDISILIILLLFMRWLSGLMSKVSVSKELGERDNFAFGVSLAGRMIALAIVLSSVVGRHVELDFQTSLFKLLIFGLLGITLVRVGRFAHDKIVLNQIDKDAMILEKNVSIALVDATSTIASAIITRSIILWTDATDIDAFVAITTGTLVVLSVLLLCTRIYEHRFAEKNQNSSFQTTLCQGQLALAIQHGGNLLAIAIAVSASASIVVYSSGAYVSNVTGWLISGICLALGVMMISSLCKRIVLYGVQWRTEVSLQHNVGIACIEAVLAIGVAVILNQLLATALA